MKKLFMQLYKWVDDRVELQDLVTFLGKKYVPVHRHSIWYYFGCFIVLIHDSGTYRNLLLFYYKGSFRSRIRKYPVHHVESGIRLADPVNPRVVGKLIYLYRFYPHVQRLF